MSLDVNNLLEAVKKAAINAVKAQKPMSVYYGVVLSVSPLKVKVDQKMILTSAQLLLTDMVQDITTQIHKPNELPTSADTRVIKLGLSAGDKVILLRCVGGQKYIIFSKVREAYG